MEINKQSLADFRKKFADAVKDLENQLNVSIGLGRISYDSEGFSSKVEVININEENRGKDARTIQIENDFKMYCFRYGLEESDLGKSFFNHGEEYVIVGIKPRSTKYPILGKSPHTGKTYKFHVDTVKNSLNK